MPEASDIVRAADRTVWPHSLLCPATCGPFLAGKARLLPLYHPSVVPSPTCWRTTDCGIGFLMISPKHKEDLWVGMGDGEDGVAAQGSHTTLPAVIIQHVIHLTAVHVHME